MFFLKKECAFFNFFRQNLFIGPIGQDQQLLATLVSERSRVNQLEQELQTKEVVLLTFFIFSRKKPTILFTLLGNFNVSFKRIGFSQIFKQRKTFLHDFQ